MPRVRAISRASYGGQQVPSETTRSFQPKKHCCLGKEIVSRRGKGDLLELVHRDKVEEVCSVVA